MTHKEIYDIRNKHNISTRRVAAWMGITERYYIKIEKGDGDVSKHFITKFNNAITQIKIIDEHNSKTIEAVDVEVTDTCECKDDNAIDLSKLTLSELDELNKKIESTRNKIIYECDYHNIRTDACVIHDKDNTSINLIFDSYQRLTQNMSYKILRILQYDNTYDNTINNDCIYVSKKQFIDMLKYMLYMYLMMYNEDEYDNICKTMLSIYKETRYK